MYHYCIMAFFPTNFDILSRSSMQIVKQSGISEYDILMLNNLFSTPFLIVANVLDSKNSGLLISQARQNIGILCCSGVLSFLIGISSLWLIGAVRPVTYSMIGSLNKIPMSILGIVLFSEPWNYVSIISIVLGLSSACMLTI